MPVVKIIELIGSSPDGWNEATQNAVTEAAKTIKNIKSVNVKRCTAKVENNLTYIRDAQIINRNFIFKIATNRR
jgi:flavin-binding protein dodecin